MCIQCVLSLVNWPVQTSSYSVFVRWHGSKLSLDDEKKSSTMYIYKVGRCEILILGKVSNCAEPFVLQKEPNILIRIIG